MRQDRRKIRARRGLIPAVERCEPRELLSGLMAAMASATQPRMGPASLTLAATALAGRGNLAPGNLAVASTDQPGSGAFANNLQVSTNPAPPIIPGLGQPTPHELARERFAAYFHGPVTYGPGRFTDQKETIYFRGLGGATQFLHGDYQMAFVIPKDPTAPITGAVYMQDKNTNSQAFIALDLVADPTSLDRHGRPTRATFVSDPNIYSGLYFFTASNGTVTIHYDSAGVATVRFRGLVYINGLTNPLRNSDLVGNGGRL